MFPTVIRIALHGYQRRTVWYQTQLPFVPPLPGVVVGPDGRPQTRVFSLSLEHPETGAGGGTIGVAGLIYSQHGGRLEIDAGEEECLTQESFEKTLVRFIACGWSMTDPRN